MFPGDGKLRGDEEQSPRASSAGAGTSVGSGTRQGGLIERYSNRR
jgi:hypothetical protein